MYQFLRKKARKIVLFGFDIVCYYAIAAFFLLMSRATTTPVFAYDVGAFFINATLLIGMMMVYRFILNVYRNVWRYTDTRSYFKMLVADVAGGATAYIIAYFIMKTVSEELYTGLWFFVILTALEALFSLLSRFSYRLLYKHFNKVDADGESRVNVAIVGAGQIGAVLASELASNQRSVYKPIFFVDSDKSKVGGRVAGLPVYNEDMTIFARLSESSIKEIFFAVNRFDTEEAERLYKFYSQSGCKLKVYDMSVRDVSEAPETEKQRRVIREFSIEDLLFRDPLKINDGKTTSYYTGKTILVTGGGGSIGGELCRQIAKCSPKKLIIVDIYENNAYDIQQELIRNYGDKLDLTVEIASVRDRERLNCIFAAYRPEVVFHAAAHKHVPLMEHSGCEAIKNNVLGTYNTADMAEKYGVQKFILVSTDKAVNPTNIMGASKRLCEMVVQCRTDSNTDFAAVRFGNVLGSNGSVIPLFKRQIANGGPVTITDKRIIRYFMTIPEASQLVMQAGAMAKKGELFVLDMGKPVRIYDLAVNMIRLSGFEPHVDIKIEEVGLRPGEKLFEELLMKTETLDKTENNMIFIERDTPLTRKEVEEKLRILKTAVELARDEIGSKRVKEAIVATVPTFRDPEVINKRAEKSEEMQMVKNS